MYEDSVNATKATTAKLDWVICGGESGIDEIISTRRLINICKAYAVFGVKHKAIKMCLARFDAATQKSFYDSYMKLDAQVAEDSAKAAAAAAATAAGATTVEAPKATSNEAPF